LFGGNINENNILESSIIVITGPFRFMYHPRLAGLGGYKEPDAVQNGHKALFKNIIPSLMRL
jgi:hypothetical protein